MTDSLSWLIEADVFGTSMEPLKQELRRRGIGHEIVHPRPFLNGVIPKIAGQSLGPGARVVFSGTYPLMREIQLKHSWIPGGWCTIENFDCSEYYQHFSGYLLNEPFRILSIENALAQQKELFEQFGDQDQIFLRPTGMEKLFTGCCVSREDFASILHSVRYSNRSVLVATPRQILREWRLIVCETAVITASQYRADGDLCPAAGCPSECVQFVEELLTQVTWRPDPIFMLDVCETNDQLRVVELNSFSCSGFYRCDPRPTVAKVIELVELEK